MMCILQCIGCVAIPGRAHLPQTHGLPQSRAGVVISDNSRVSFSRLLKEGDTCILFGVGKRLIKRLFFTNIEICNIDEPTRCNNDLLIYKISSTCFGQYFAHHQERETEKFTAYGILLLWWVGRQ